MIFIDKMKNFKIYKTPMFLPTMENDKKKKCAVLIMSPNYESSKRLMTNNLFVNKLRYASYYLKRDVSFYINSKVAEEIEESFIDYNLTNILEKYDDVSNSEFGLPDRRKYPLDTPERVKSAIKFFNYCDEKDEKELSDNIKKAIEKFDLSSEINISKKNRFSKYYESDIEEGFIYEADNRIKTDMILNNISDSYINTGDKVIFFTEDASDAQLKRLLFPSRIRQRKDLLVLYDNVKNDIPFIKFAFPDITKYKSKNLFVDLYYYNKIFFENNNWVLNKGLNLYLTFMSRLLNDPDLKAGGYEKKTIFIPVTDWSRDPMLWNFKKSLNPMSVIYQLMMTASDTKIKSIFGNSDIIFTGSDKYFKVNFSQIQSSDDMKKLAIKFKMFLIKIVKNEEFDLIDVDTSADNAQTPDVIKANILDKIELAKGVDLTPNLASVQKAKKLNKDMSTNSVSQNAVNKKAIKDLEADKEKSYEEKNISKLTKNSQDLNNDQLANDRDADIEKLVSTIDDIADNSTSEEDVLDTIDDDEDLKQIIMDLDADGEDKPDITAGRAGRISELDEKLLKTEVKGKTIEDILEPKEKKETPKMELNISSPNEEWNEISYVNFDKNYDIDRDIIRIFRMFEHVSRPMGIRNIKVENNSTSEDRVELYTVEMEDYRGKRFTIKLDIPIMVDNRFLLRGNSKTIQTQFFNMPIIKTDDDTCQIISNYMKIFVRRFGSSAGKSLPLSSKFLKACNKYTGRDIKIDTGDNHKICSKYVLPIDYIDLSCNISRIETNDFIVYFNQDEIRSNYTIDNAKQGFPYLYNKKEKTVEYFNSSGSFISELVSRFDSYTEFSDLIVSATKPTICAYSRCSIMNSQIPLVIICAYHEGLRRTLDKGLIKYSIESTLTKEIRHDPYKDWIKFNDGYLIYDVNYESSLLMNGLKTCSTDSFSIADIDNRNMYLEFLDNFGGRIKADGLENFYDLMVDPMTKDSLEFYKFPTDYVSELLYANSLLADNKFIRHTDTSSKRLRRYILIAVYTYKVLADAYAMYSNQLKHNMSAAEFSVKQSAVIDKFLTDTITSDDSCINALMDVESTNSITTKGPSGMNSDRAYSLDKRTYDESMLNILGMSTGFAGNVGITRQATIDANVDENGYVKSINGDTSKMNTTGSLTITEALTPFGSAHDDPMRTAMTFIQTSKHFVRTEESDPLLVTNGADEALPYLTTNRFAYKAKGDGKIEEMTDEYILISYKDGTKDYINLVETIEKNSDGGYYVPLKLDVSEGLKIGSRVSANQIVAYDKYSFSNSVGESNNIAYNIGKLAKVAILNSDEGFEDSGVITEKMASKLATRINLKFNSTIDKETNIVSIVKVGDHVECGDPLLVWQSPFDDDNANSLMKTLASDDVSELGKRKLKTEVTGTVTAIKIFRTIELDDMSESLRKIVKAYEKPYIEMEKKFRENNLDISSIPAHTILPPTGKLKKAQNAVLFEIYVEYKDTVGVGDKIVYFSANKAVEKNLIPLGKEPYTDFRPNESIDAFVSEVSIDKRMVTSTILIGSLQKLMIELDRSVKDIMGIPYDDSTV